MSKIVLEHLTLEELGFIANGCGPKFFGWIVPDLIFGEACVIHDVRYYVGGSEADRFAADVEFKVNMLAAANKQSSWRWWWRTRAQIFYRAVRVLGKGAFHYGKKRTYEDLRGDMSYAYSL